MVAVARPNAGSKCNVSIWVLLLTNVLVFQLTWNMRDAEGGDSFELLSKSTVVSSSSGMSAPSDYILIPPKGEAVAIPGVQVAKEDFKSNEIYGGKGDKSHLGGWTDLDHHGVSPSVWKWMVTDVGVHSVLDVGCGRGISTSWFYFHGLDVRCVEGSHDAIENTVLPDRALITEHDFSQGPWWPEKTYDAVWCVEFLEHVSRNLQKNYFTALRKSALIFASHSIWGGHHHVEVHDEPFWVTKFAMFGFIYSEDLTKKIREKAVNEKFKGLAPNNIKLNAQHIYMNMKVFINPAVAALPQHAHLLAEPGCFVRRENGARINRECGEGKDATAALESKLPLEFRALTLTPEQDTKWFEHVKARVKQREDPEAELKLNRPTKK